MTPRFNTKNRNITRTVFSFVLVGAIVVSNQASGWAQPDNSVFDKFELIEEIDAGQIPVNPQNFKESAKGDSKVETILGQKTRVLPNKGTGVRYFAYRLGRGKGLKANEPYLLEIEYPEDKPRAMIILNRGDETNRGFYTGRTLGDALSPHYVNNNPESLEIPLTGKFEKARLWVSLQERFSEIAFKRNAEVPDPAMTMRTMTPDDGFWVYVTQFEPDQDPFSHGAAVSKIRLYKAPDLKEYALDLRLPPESLPRRHLFFREEMADNVIFAKNNTGFEDPLKYHEGKAKLMRFLGMNTIAKDLLEFGANQGWDSSKFGGRKWVFQSRHPKLWNGIVDIATKYGLSLLPYYEYSGSKGKEGLGFQKRAEPLNGENYTHVRWTETARADLTDPETFEDFRKMLEITIVDMKNKGDIVGAWLRPRSSQLPISFADATIKRFTQETNRSNFDRSQLKQGSDVYEAYIKWWKGKRKAFLEKIQDYLRKSGIKDPLVLYTADPTEPGLSQPGNGTAGLVVESMEAWKSFDHKKPIVSLDQAVKERWSYKAQTQGRPTWGEWEWHHAVPGQDPENYQDSVGVMPTYGFNRAYTVEDTAALEAFTTKSGIAMIRHFSLNEDMLRVKVEDKKLEPLGYFVADMERSGPYIMLAEVRAMANGDPTQLGYLASNNFNRLFPEYVRDFNAAFLSLPALPSVKLKDAASDPDVVVRQIDGGEHGTWLVVVNPSYNSKEQVRIHLPVKGLVTNAATGEELVVKDHHVSLGFYPCQLVSLHIR